MEIAAEKVRAISHLKHEGKHIENEIKSETCKIITSHLTYISKVPEEQSKLETEKSFEEIANPKFPKCDEGY